MRDKDLQRIGIALCGIIWLIAMKMPFEAFCLVAVWAVVLAFDSLENRSKSGMVMFDD